MSEPFWVVPGAIRFKISPQSDLSAVEGGDWDIERRHCLSAAVKHQAIVQRFTEGRRWEETDLFRDIYARRMASGDKVRGAENMKALAAQYYDRVDALYADMKCHGFRLKTGRRSHPLPVLLIGRNGEVFIGNQGNHRLAIAKALGLSEIAGRIICRHRLSM